MPRISIKQLTKRYENFIAVESLDLEVEQGEFVVLLGPSGCGKTTTLRMIAGFIEPTAGSIAVGERDITNLPAYARNIGIVFQNYALFPHLTVFENVAFGLKQRKMLASDIEAKVKAALQMVKMDHLSQRKPREMSGGQQQRVAIARAIVIEPDVLLLDEPLSNLDAKLRSSIRAEIRRLQKQLGITTVLVTHDQEEAMSIADRLVVMSGGVVQQIGTPQDVYMRPSNRFVADFIGAANFLAGSVVSGKFQTSAGTAFASDNLPADCKEIAIRPEQVRISKEQTSGENNVFPATISNIVYLGAAEVIEARLETGDDLSIHVSAGHGGTYRTQEKIFVEVPPSRILALGAGEAR